MRTVIVLALALAAASVSTSSNANEIYIDQSGDFLWQDVIQDGDGNQIKGISQTDMKLDGDYNYMINHQWGDNHLQEIEVDGNSNYTVIAQGGGGNNNSAQVSVTGANNYTGVFQGFHYDGFGFYEDTDETGGHEAFVTTTGDYNSHMSTQTDTNRSSGGGSPHHLANIYNGDFNRVEHIQMGKAGHDGFVEIQGDDNTVDLYQRGNGGAKWADIVLTGDGHTVDVMQRGTNSASATVDLTNSGGAYNFTLTQNVTTSADTYSITGYCYNSAGCGVTVNRNN